VNNDILDKIYELFGFVKLIDETAKTLGRNDLLWKRELSQP
jgi:hypothetical protein|tara:strand:+ start:743 stop:865 length:123 start_codon:yes stop_codon:yes gene_type:complete